jgi:hypothetical protein
MPEPSRQFTEGHSRGYNDADTETRADKLTKVRVRKDYNGQDWMHGYHVGWNYGVDQSRKRQAK